MHILIAPNAFKNSLDAAKVAEAISNGLHKSKLSCTTTCFPVADGGDGTAGLLIDHFGGQLINAIVKDPLKRKISSSFGWIEKDKTAVIELDKVIPAEVAVVTNWNIAPEDEPAIGTAAESLM